MTRVRFRLNGTDVSAEVPASTSLLRMLRLSLAHTAPKEACGRGECGACTILIDDMPVLSCLEFAVRAEGRTITTSEGLGAVGERIGKALVEHGGMQCGFCTPGQVVRASTLIGSARSEPEIRHAISGNVCRCTGYSQIVDAIWQVVAAEETTR